MTTALLLSASIDGAIAAGVVWLICRLVPSLPAGARAMLWWCARREVHRRARVDDAAGAAGAAGGGDDRRRCCPPADGTVAATVAPAAPEDEAGRAGNALRAARTPFFWPQALLLMWAAGVAASLIAGLAHWRRARAILRDAATAPART
jgi:hypothetical protein